MRPLTKALLYTGSIVSATSIVSTSIYSIVYDVNRPAKTYIVEPTKEQKEKICEKGSDVCQYELTLKEDVTDKQKVKVTPEVTSTWEGKNIEVLVEEEPVIKDKNISFKIRINPILNATTNVWAKFDIKLECVNKSDSKTIWNQTLKDFKLTTQRDVEKHNITVATQLNGISFTTQTTSVNETQDIILDINFNGRSVNLVDANLTVTAGQEHINLPIDSEITAAGKQLIYTKKQLKEIFVQQGKTIEDNDDIKFDLVRSGAYSWSYGKLYQFDDYGNNVLISDDKIPENMILIKNASNELLVSDKTFVQIIDSATKPSYDLYFTKGIYFNEHHGTANSCDLNIHGIVDSNNNLLTTLRAYRDEQATGQPYGVGASNISFNLYNLKVQGTEGEKNWLDLSHGFVCQNINASYCDFYGAYTLWNGKSTFQNCYFNSTNAYKPAGNNQIKNLYPMFIYGLSQATFVNCEFESIGKAIKIYSDGEAVGTEINKTVEIKNCTFNLVDPQIPGKTMAEYEFPINADVTNLNTIIYNIKIENCTINDYWKQQKSKDPYNPYWIKAKNLVSGKAKNIAINGESVFPDEIANNY